MTQHSKTQTFSALAGKVQITSHVRSSEDPVWLASAIQADEGAKLLEVGCGNGIASLCLLARKPSLHITGVDINPTLIEEALTNAQHNNTQLNTTQHDILKEGLSETFDHTFSNPPYHNTNKGFRSDSEGKKTAHGTSEEQALIWVQRMLDATKEGGSLTLIHHKSFQDSILEQLEEHSCKVIELKTSQTKPAKRIIIQCIKNGESTLDKLTVNAYEADIRQAILEHGESLWEFTE